MRVIVVGAGVIGLTCAVRLAEAGHEVDVVARDLPLETTSAVAAALWYPYLALPVDRVTAWAQQAYAVFAELAELEEEAGVRMRWGTELFRVPTPDPEWAAAVPRLERVEALPDGYRDGWRLRAPVVDMRRYLPWLVRRLELLGGTLTRLALPALPWGGDVVVNASGIAARFLAHDPDVQPVRGQVVYVEQVGLDEWWLDESDPVELCYVVPRTSEIVVGGTAQVGDWNRRPDQASARRMLDRATRLVPVLAKADVRGHRVGLRPARPSVALLTEHRPDAAPIVHCYGHGGAGVTLSWGCAAALVAEVSSLAR